MGHAAPPRERRDSRPRSPRIAARLARLSRPKAWPTTTHPHVRSSIARCVPHARDAHPCERHSLDHPSVPQPPKAPNPVAPAHVPARPQSPTPVPTPIPPPHFREAKIRGGPCTRRLARRAARRRSVSSMSRGAEHGRAQAEHARRRGYPRTLLFGARKLGGNASSRDFGDPKLCGGILTRSLTLLA